MVKQALIITAIILAGVVGYRFFPRSVPLNYSGCIKNPLSDHNRISCSMEYLGNSSRIKECLGAGGCNPAAADGPHGCSIGFINPNFVYPTDLEECKNLGNKNYGSINVNNERCWFMLNSACNRNIEESNKIVELCPTGYELKKYERDGSGRNFRTCEKFFYK